MELTPEEEIQSANEVKYDKKKDASNFVSTIACHVEEFKHFL